VSGQSRAALAAIVGLVVGLGTLAGVVLALRGAGGDGAEELAPTDTEIVDTGATGALPPIETTPADLSQTIDVGGLPNAVAVGEGGVWVVREGRRLIRIDPQTSTIAARIGAGDEIGSDRPCGVAVGAGAVWVTTRSGNVARINPATNRVARLIEVDDATCVAVGSGGVWVTSPDLGLVTRINPATNETVAEIPVGGFPLGIAVGFGSVWVASPGAPGESEGVVSRLDRQANAVIATIPLTGAPEYLGTALDAVWVTSDDGTIQHIDPARDELVEPPGEVSEGGRTTLAAADEVVWAAPIGALGIEANAVRIDEPTGELVGEPIPVGDSPLGMAFGAGSLWVTNYEIGTVTVFTPDAGP
jgi:DNA-binding beta-propeller fold protein YncE